jgi:hypothetical protein
MNCEICNRTILPARAELGYTTCIPCSDRVTKEKREITLPSGYTKPTSRVPKLPISEEEQRLDDWFQIRVE